MTGTDAIDYLGLQEDCRIAVDRDSHLAIIEFAEDRGFYTGVWDGIPVEYATAQASGLEGYDDYDGDLDQDLVRIATEAIDYLTEIGLLPEGYGTRTPGYHEGFGLLPNVGEGS